MNWRAPEYADAPALLQSPRMGDEQRASAAREEPAGLTPRSTIRGSFRAPGSKSLAQRALLIAGLCDGETRIAGLPNGADVAAAVRVLGQVGASPRQLAPAALAVRGRPPSLHSSWHCDRPLEVGESGTLARFVLAILGFCGQPGGRESVRATGTLAARSSAPLLDALERGGVSFARRAWPIELTPIGPPSSVVLRDPCSSQEASALAIALCAWPDENELRIEGELPSRPYFEMTLRVLEHFGARVRRSADAVSETLLLRGPLRAPPDPFAIEPDASLAAVALAAGCLSGGEVAATGFGSTSLQGDVAIVEHLRAFGCRALARGGALVASGFPQHGAQLDLGRQPDLAPVLAIVAAGAALLSTGGESVLRGLETLPGKESSRIAVLAEGLRRAGWRARESERELWIGAPDFERLTAPIELDPHGDHRMVFAFALLGLLRPGVRVLDSSCVAKSWPGFWRDLGALDCRAAANLG